MTYILVHNVLVYISEHSSSLAILFHHKLCDHIIYKDKNKDKDTFIGPQEFVVHMTIQYYKNNIQISNTTY